MAAPQTFWQLSCDAQAVATVQCSAPLVPNWTAIACEEKKMRALAEEKNAMLEAQIEMLRNLVCELSNRPTIEAYKQLEADLALARTVLHDEGAIKQAHNIPITALGFSR